MTTMINYTHKKKSQVYIDFTLFEKSFDMIQQVLKILVAKLVSICLMAK